MWFADIDPKTYLLDFDKVKLLLESSPRGTFKGIIPVDFAGRPVDLESYKKLADESWIFGLFKMLVMHLEDFLEILKI